MPEFDGTIIEYQDGDQLHLGCTIDSAKSRVRVIDDAGNRTKVAERRVMWKHAGHVVSEDQWGVVCQELRQRIAQRQAELEVELLWESVENEELAVSDLAATYFGDDEPTARSAVWRGLVADAVHFKRKGTLWVRRSPEQIATLREQEKLRVESESKRKLTEEWMRQSVRHAEPRDTPAETQETVDRIDNWLYRRSDDRGAEKLLQDVAPFLEPNEAAFRLLVSAGRLAPEADRYLALGGLTPEFPEAVTQAADSLTEYEADDEPLPADFSIDDAETREVDDALSVCQEGNDWRVAIDIADVAHFVRPGDPLDLEAGRRATTVYLPTVSVCMLPERLSCDLASLRQDCVRPAVRFEVVLNTEGEIRSFDLRRTPVSIQRRLHYEDADAALGYGDGETDVPAETIGKLESLRELAAKLREQRKSWGAMTFERPEWKVSAVDGEVSVKEIDRKSPSRNLVAEFMILANSLAGKLARDQNVPLIFRTQDPPSEDIAPMEEYDPAAFDKVRRLLRPARLSLHPGNHFGLGVSPYSQVTSPLRRYADLVMQRQLCAHLAGEELPYSQDELFQVLARAEGVERQVSRAESAAILHYMLVYLEEHCADTTLESVVLAQVRGGYRVELAKWGISAFLGTSQSLRPGARVEAKIRKVDPPNGSLKLSL